MLDSGQWARSCRMRWRGDFWTSGSAWRGRGELGGAAAGGVVRRRPIPAEGGRALPRRPPSSRAGVEIDAEGDRAEEHRVAAASALHHDHGIDVPRIDWGLARV